ncbi:MAG: type 1 glutamine amidotransferase [Chloroflexi bacterium]|nr:type 1 glutamine amidotransferase [Chloroflexota bacterium]
MLSNKHVAILVEEGFEDLDITEPMKALKHAGFKVTIVGTGSSNIYNGKNGKTKIHPDTIAAKVNAVDFDAIVIPGGHAPDRMRSYKAVVDLVQQAHAANKIIGAICYGSQLLIEAGILRGRTITSCSSIVVDIKNAGANWVDKPVIKDGTIITARKSGDLGIFNKVLIEALNSRK